MLERDRKYDDDWVSASKEYYLFFSSLVYGEKKSEKLLQWEANRYYIPDSKIEEVTQFINEYFRFLTNMCQMNYFSVDALKRLYNEDICELKNRMSCGGNYCSMYRVLYAITSIVTEVPKYVKYLASEGYDDVVSTTSGLAEQMLYKLANIKIVCTHTSDWSDVYCCPDQFRYEYSGDKKDDYDLLTNVNSSYHFQEIVNEYRRAQEEEGKNKQNQRCDRIYDRLHDLVPHVEGDVAVVGAIVDERIDGWDYYTEDTIHAAPQYDTIIVVGERCRYFNFDSVLVTLATKSRTGWYLWLGYRKHDNPARHRCLEYREWMLVGGFKSSWYYARVSLDQYFDTLVDSTRLYSSMGPYGRYIVKFRDGNISNMRRIRRKLLYFIREMRERDYNDVSWQVALSGDNVLCVRSRIAIIKKLLCDSVVGVTTIT